MAVLLPLIVYNLVYGSAKQTLFFAKTISSISISIYTPSAILKYYQTHFSSILELYTQVWICLSKKYKHTKLKKATSLIYNSQNIKVIVSGIIDCLLLPQKPNRNHKNR